MATAASRSMETRVAMAMEESRSLETRTGRDEGRDEVREKAISFYLANLPKYISDKEHWLECRNYGHVVDAYIAKKRDKQGRRFAFARFIKVRNIEKMLKSLNYLKLRGMKISVNLAKFNKRGNGIDEKKVEEQPS
ncbi:hypothetical protein L1987_13606 [Smallanthus sonchifolius]|uniref:Uncharacterized protein n=1 Tax=Smallanthus sonchifolius TaxID=185202 RepID=A0ACB9JGX2_9ASTR|nr:hypothetical protein L1987_13606 [Smallanthus sonchifolius]